MAITGRDQGQYRIQAVAEMTGIPAATLRAWERRYGIPAPARTATAYRLYSEEDVAQVRRMKELCERGLAPAQAALTLREPAAEAPSSESDPWQIVVRRIEEAVDRWDTHALEEAVQGALVMGSATQIFERIIAPAQVRIGDRWHAGTLTVAQEHLCTQILHGVTQDLLRFVQREDAPRTALLACFADEQHVLPLHGIAFRFAGWGYRTVLLGARTPPGALASAIFGLQPDVVGLSTTVPPPDAAALLGDYAAACSTTPWFVGGHGSAAIADAVHQAGGIVAPGDPGELRERVEAAIVEWRARPREA